MKHRRITTNQIDSGELVSSRREFAGLAFVGCGLSISNDKRSRFEGCTFRDISVDRCVVGFPVFTRCHFENITAVDLVTFIYGSVFLECTVAGALCNVNLGLNVGDLGFSNSPDGQRFGHPTAETRNRIKEENRALLREARFSLDLRQAALENVSVIGEEIVPYLRLRRDQGMIWRGESLAEKVICLGRSVNNATWSDILLGNAPPNKEDQVCVAIAPEGSGYALNDLEPELRRIGLEVNRFE